MEQISVQKQGLFEIAPTWADVIFEGLETTHDISSAQDCAVGEAYGWIGDYADHDSPNYCETCHDDSLAFNSYCCDLGMSLKYGYGDEEIYKEGITKTADSFVKHFKEKHQS